MEHLDCIIYINKTFEEAKALSVNGEVVITGDAYHDKIDHMIGGFFYGLDYVITNGRSIPIQNPRKRLAQMMRCLKPVNFMMKTMVMTNEKKIILNIREKRN